MEAIYTFPIVPTISSTTGYDLCVGESKNKPLKDMIEKLTETAGKEDWDGEGALALSSKTIVIAQYLVDFFPSFDLEPDISATPHGEIDFEWAISRDTMLTISVGPSGEIAFAGLFGNTRLDGQEELEDKRLPHFVSACFKRLQDVCKDDVHDG